MATDTKMGEGRGFDVTGMAKAWKEGYLTGLEASLQWQERNEYWVKETLRQGLEFPHQWFTVSKSLFGKPWDELQGQTDGVPNPFVAFTLQFLQASQDMAGPLLKTTAHACQTTFEYYETTVGGPSRKFTLEFNKKVIRHTSGSST